MSQLRMQNQLGIVRPEATYQMDDTVQTEVRQVGNVLIVTIAIQGSNRDWETWKMKVLMEETAFSDIFREMSQIQN